ncbi:TetR/AcrR family transcriptional regulator [Chryseobacterium sp. ISL-6]|uniref:TetR/AcrR family transcriptional regulator n=1 Tax=Chryseobacterium sp. ISL-6 TaxID=2819143 RepID=UPI001BE581EF|nr:TetR/AcrR family transcriptional regulator [Chryseobacterium sp. ISL-6]MBT2622800.1 TetR/AcrR family transcriptional regulator [Chryseobacterium sp. ISL-6]
MAGRPKIFDEHQAIEKAIHVFKDKGYDTASADELLNAMGIGKGSFYLAFKGGKRELYIRSIEQFAEGFNNSFLEQLSKSDNQIEFIKQFFLKLAEAHNCDEERGCYLGNALVQLSEKDNEVKRISVGFLKNLQQVFAEAIRKAQSTGQIKNNEEAEILAWHLTNLWNGLHVTRRMEDSPKIFRSLIEMNLKILE